MTSNYIIHIGNEITNKRLKFKEVLNKHEQRILEQNANIFFYLLINLIFDYPIKNFRLSINRKYIDFKNKKKIHIVLSITRKLLELSNINIKKKTNTIENQNWYVTNTTDNTTAYPAIRQYEPCYSKTITSISSPYAQKEINIKRLHVLANTILTDNSTILPPWNNGTQQKHNLIIHEEKNTTSYNYLLPYNFINNQKIINEKKKKKLEDKKSIFENVDSFSVSLGEKYNNYLKSNNKIKENKLPLVPFCPLYVNETGYNSNSHNNCNNQTYNDEKNNNNLYDIIHNDSLKNSISYTVNRSDCSRSSTTYNKRCDNINNSVNNLNSKDYSCNSHKNELKCKINNNDIFSDCIDIFCNDKIINNPFNYVKSDNHKKDICTLKKKKKEDKVSGINIFDEFLVIHLLFRLRGGKGGFGANLRNKKKKKKKKKNTSNNNINDASRTLKGNRILLDNIIKSTENLLTKKKMEQNIIDKFNSVSHIAIDNTSHDNTTNTNDIEYNKSNDNHTSAIKQLQNHNYTEETTTNQKKQNNEQSASNKEMEKEKENLYNMVANGILHEKKKKKTQKDKIQNKKSEKTKKMIKKKKNVNKNISLKTIDGMYTFL
ncbi:conserved protein, unknown function [Hepatocystis sp. ex Piliocolobus tephrosceles]|nr:conserved protein, unknown function [Hepatocystis sp. ex Piliocolobus tephrosceles]